MRNRRAAGPGGGRPPGGARGARDDPEQRALAGAIEADDADGLPRRDWFKHQIYAPGFYTGYGVKTMPQIREGLEEKRFDEAQGGVRTVSAAVNALAAQVQEAAGALAKVAR